MYNSTIVPPVRPVKSPVKLTEGCFMSVGMKKQVIMRVSHNFTIKLCL